MTRPKADLAVGILIGIVLVVGIALTWQTSQATTTGMGHGWAMHGVHPIWNLLGTLLVAVGIAGMYALIRDQIHDSPAAGVHSDTETAERTSETQTATETVAPTGADQSASSNHAADDILAFLPDDERRILTPVIESPGLTQIELRDRADFSKSKVSQTVSALETRGLIYRESQGRTYRVYPTEKLQPGTGQ